MFIMGKCGQNYDEYVRPDLRWVNKNRFIMSNFGKWLIKKIVSKANILENKFWLFLSFQFLDFSDW